MLKRNRFGFRMRRRSLTNRLLQFIVISSCFFLFIYFLIYALNLNSDVRPPDFSWLKTRNMSHYTLNAPALIEPECDADYDRDLRLLALIHSAPHNFERRKAIRATWSKGLKELPGVQVYFFLGASQHDDREIENEAKEFGDIIQMDFKESYLNLTIKTTLMLKWITLNNRAPNKCHKTPKFILKVDDDAFVNPSVLWANLEHALLHTTTTKSMASFIPQLKNLTQEDMEKSKNKQLLSESIDYLFMGHAMTSVPIRDQGNKWYLPPKFYPLNIFPRFISGSGYVVTSSVAPMLYECALATPYMNLEDVFLSGLCATSQLGLVLTHNPLFRFRKPIVQSDYVCFYKTSAMVHPMEDVAGIEAVYARLSDDHNCDTFYFGFIKSINHGVDFLKNILRV